ncbi:MAG: PAS domain S-box protein [Verrucomicrobiota bacterium]
MKNKLRILLIEDIVDDAELITRQLLRSGLNFEWRCVDSEAAFLRELEGFTPHLILSDYKLPKFDGLTALSIARKQYPEIPFILVSGFLGEELAVEAMRSGAADFVLKERLWTVAPAVQRALREAEERSKRRLSQQAARESELKFSALTETLPAIIFIHQDGALQYVNAMAEAILGYSKVEFAAKNLLEIVPPEFRKLVSELVLPTHRAETQPASTRCEFQVVTREGKLKWLDCVVTAIAFGGQPAVLGAAFDIDEQKRTNELLRARDEQFEQITGCIREVFWITDAAKNEMVYVSPGYEEIWGRTCESLRATPQDWVDAIHPEDQQRVLRAATQKQICGDYDEVYRVVRPDGSIRWIQDRAFPVRNAVGEIYRVSGIAEDITVRKEAEEALRESEDRFRTLFEYAPIGIALHNAKGAYLQTNQTYQKMVGYTGEELSRVGVKKITHPEDVAEGQRLFGELLQGKRDFYRREKRYLKKDGEIIWAHSTASAVRHPTGKLRYIVSMVEDVTERRLAEIKNRAILNAIPDFILRVGSNGTVLDCKVPKIANFGIKPEEYIGQNIFERFSPEKSRQHIGQALQSFLKNALQTSEVQVLGFKMIVKGGLHDFEARAVASGKDEVLAIIRDTTEQSRLEKEVLEISEREQRRIGHDLHDELGQFLGAIAWKAKMLEQTLDENSNALAPSVTEIVKMVNQAIRQTRDLAKGLDPVGIVSDGLVSALKQLARDTEEAFSISCSSNGDESFPHLDQTKGVQLYRIAKEAVHNCLRHANADRIQIQLTQEMGRIILTVKDTGVGFRLDSAANAGLGFHIMQYRARSIGGYLEIDSRLNQGSEVRCVVPVSAETLVDFKK